jgi:hypothetical protein
MLTMGHVSPTTSLFLQPLARGGLALLRQLRQHGGDLVECSIHLVIGLRPKPSPKRIVGFSIRPQVCPCERRRRRQDQLHQGELHALRQAVENRQPLRREREPAIWGVHGAPTFWLWLSPPIKSQSIQMNRQWQIGHLFEMRDPGRVTRLHLDGKACEIMVMMTSRLDYQRPK